MTSNPGSKLSRHHWKLLKEHLPFYQALDKGTMKPRTLRQQRFLEVCRGREDPKFDHEFAYIGFLEFKRWKEAKANKIGRVGQHPREQQKSRKPSQPPEWFLEQQKNEAARRAGRSIYNPRRPEGYGRAASKEWEKKFEPTKSPRSPIGRGDYRIPEYEEGVPRPGWFTDTDWKINRGRQKYDGPF